jgi:lipopolysaccharide cholinephosphotransferase
MSETVKLTSETLRELQLKQLDMLKYFRDFCDKNSLRFYLIGGGLIGALRNGGFVPWDDDVDVLMPRNDYEKLNKLWKEQHADGRFRLLKTDDEMFTGNIFITVTDTNYTMVKSNQTEVDIPHGLVLDVFPLDVCPNSRFARKMQFVWTLLYSLFLAQVVPENHGGLVGFGSKILLGIFRGKKLRNRIWRFCERKMTQYKLE